MLEIVEREPFGSRVCVPLLCRPHVWVGVVRRIGQHELSYRGMRVVGRLVHERPSHAVPGYSLLFHAVVSTEERKCLPLWLLSSDDKGAEDVGKMISIDPS